MGTPKALLGAPGETLLERVVRLVRPHFSEILVSGDPGSLAFAGCRVVPDRVPDRGPMMAVASTLAVAENELAMVIPVDMPDPPLDLMLRLLDAAGSGADVAVPVVGGLYEPLFAVYRRSVVPLMDELLSSGCTRIFDLYPRVRTLEIEIPTGLTNLNTRADWEAWRRSPPCR